MVVARFAGPGNPPGIAIVHSNNGFVTTVAYLGGDNFYFLNDYHTPDTPFDLVPGVFTSSGNIDLAVSESTLRIEYIGYGDGNGNFNFTQIGFENGVGSPVAGRLRPGVAQDIVLVQPLNNTLMLLLNKNP